MAESRAQRPRNKDDQKLAAWRRNRSGFILLPDTDPDPHNVVLFPAGWEGRYQGVIDADRRSYVGGTRQQLPFYCTGAAYVFPSSPGLLFVK